MPAFPAGFTGLLARCRDPGLAAHTRGQTLEDLIALAFEAVPGVEVHARNAKSVFENEELDLVVTNRATDDGLPLAGSIVSIECKNWSRPVGSAEVSWFGTKLRRSGQSFGVLVAAEGVTGREREMTAAHYEAAAALSEGQTVVVLTMGELEWLASGEELAALLTEKHTRLVARRELFIQEHRPEAGVLPRLLGRTVTHSERDAMLASLEAAVSDAPTLIRSIDVTVEHYRDALETFLDSEFREPHIEIGDDGSFNRWAEQNFILFENLQSSLRRIGQACIAELRSKSEALWPVDHLALGLDTSTPQNLKAPPDSDLAEFVISIWINDIKKFDDRATHDVAALSLLGWSIEWLLAMAVEHWPSPGT